MICRAPLIRRDSQRDIAAGLVQLATGQPEWEGWKPVDNRLKLTPKVDKGGRSWVATLMMEKELT